MNVNKLKGKIIEKGMNVEKLAGIIGLDRSTLYRKINDFEKITIGEVERIKNALELTDEEATSIFFDLDVASRATYAKAETHEQA